jgi:hypothetical protein
VQPAKSRQLAKGFGFSACTCVPFPFQSHREQPSAQFGIQSVPSRLWMKDRNAEDMVRYNLDNANESDVF